jgi:hypothetical protein
MTRGRLLLPERENHRYMRLQIAIAITDAIMKRPIESPGSESIPRVHFAPGAVFTEVLATRSDWN